MDMVIYIDSDKYKMEKYQESRREIWFLTKRTDLENNVFNLQVGC